jgi:DNA mismatch repair protein MutS2
MDAHALRVLEFPAVLACLAREAGTPLGQEAAEALGPGTDPAAIAEALDAVAEAREALLTARLSMDGIHDIREAVAAARVAGTCLDPVTLGEIASTFGAARRLRAACAALKGSWPRLKAAAARLTPPGEVLAELRRCLTPDGGVADEASAELTRLRKQVAAQREAILATLHALLQVAAAHGTVTESFVTLRNDRYVIPVTREGRSRIRGIVQDQSASGETLFLEPEGVVEQNTRLRLLRQAEEREVRRVLTRLTGLVGTEADGIEAMVQALAALDLLLAKARLADRWGAACPALAADCRLTLRRARHPLLLEHASQSNAPVVPIDLEVGGRFRVLVITGPNTGGKTVALKTAGLLTLMALAGLHIPASADSAVPVFDGLFADIGDEQSIAQSLSTFSSHIGQIGRILSQATARSLVLLDELGAGTDPAEGAALAVAVLENLLRQGPAVVATTHLEAVKIHAARTPGMENASAEFDLETLRPLYRLSLGVPGRSFALEIASRLGVPDPIVARAREILGPAALHAGDLVAGLASDRRAAEAARREAEGLLTEAAEARGRYQTLWSELQRETAALRRQARSDAEAAVAAARREAETLVARLRTSGADREAIRAFQRDLADLARRTGEGVAPPPDAAAAPDLRPGQAVHLPAYRQRGTVLEEVAADGTVAVQLPVGKVRVPAGQVHLVGPEEEPAAFAATVPAVEELPLELNLLGARVEEAISRAEQYLDDAFLAGAPRVRIVHGKGTGALRRAIAELLRAHPLVERFSLAEAGEGGSGATVVELQRR